MPALGFGCDLSLRPAPGGGAARYDFMSGTMPAGVTLSRASTGSVWTAQRTLAWVAADQPRFDHDPATGGLRGLLLEPARSNLIPRHDDVGSEWTNGGFVTGPGAVAPGGGASQRLTVPGGSYGPYRAITLSLAAGETVTLSVHLRAAAPAMVAVGTNGVGNNGNNRGGPVAIGPDWARRSFTLTAAADSGVFVMPFSLHPSNGGGGLAGVTGDLWGMQLERGDAPSSLIPTTGAAATRAADRLHLDWARLGRGDGPATLRVGYADGSVQTVATTVAAGRSTVTAAAGGPGRACLCWVEIA